MAGSVVGKRVRLSRILPDGRSIIFAFDHGIEHGPSDFPPDRKDARIVIREVVEAGVDAIMTTPGVAILTSDIWAGRVPLIVKVTGKTVLRPGDEQMLQSPIGGVREAVSLGADAIAATVYWGSKFEDYMLERWARLREEADSVGMPVLQLAYPRGPSIKNRYSVEVVAYGARAAVEVGADLIKTYYTGSSETFREVVEAASGVPVLMSGGPKTENPIDFLRSVEGVMKAGGRGVVVGRNVFQSKDMRSMVKALRMIVHEGATAEEAYRALER